MRRIAVCLLAVGVMFALPVDVVRAETINVGDDAFSQDFTPNGRSRGFWFVAPVDFTITGIGVPFILTDQTNPDVNYSAENFDIAVLRFAATPPEFTSSTTAFDTLLYQTNIAGTAPFATDIDVKAGEIIGILGSRGQTAINSFAQSGGVDPNGVDPYPFASSILGDSVDLFRLGQQASLRDTAPGTAGVHSLSTFYIGRVFVDVEATEEDVAHMPLPPALPLFATGLAGIAYISWRRRRRDTDA